MERANINNIDISIIIVSYNTKDLLLNCIRSIVDTVKKTKYEIIVVDNASTDGTCGAISNFKFQPRLNRGQISNFKLIKSDKNIGYSAANNIGVKQSKGRFVLFLNPDTLIYEKTIDGMVKFMDENEKVGAATCFVELPNKELDDAAHRGFPTPWRAFSHFSYLSKIFPQQKLFSGYSLSHLDLEHSHDIDACAGAFMIVRREAGEEVKWWDESFFWYGEDLDFCYRLKEKGWKIFFVPDYKILHYKGVSGGIKNISRHLSIADKETKTQAINARFKAMEVFYNKHYQNKYPFIISSLIKTGIKSRWFMSRLRNQI
ncbi:glycosyltransferase family 2 protein [Candidatus Parcubacteria bacterium]|nr:MAG: glycosyltransferase family 2 protein [Candidatus Parcubacteria bacterium]